MLVERKPASLFFAPAVACATMIALAVTPFVNADDLDVSFPYQAIVLKDSAAVHSGPGQVHYATDKLEQGAVVEVHRHDPGGWCAVRPTKGSFSLVPSAAVDVIDDQVGEVIESGTQAWVGTRLGAVEKPLWQVKLREGERVEILGEVSWPHPEGHSTIWYQISPPAGEFRWMRISDLQLPPSAKVATVTADNSGSERENPAQHSNVRSLVDIPVLPAGPIQQAQPIKTALIPPSMEAIQTVSPETGQPREPAQIQLASASQPDSMNLGWRRSTRPIPNTESGFDQQTLAGAGQARPAQPVRVASNSPAAGFDQLPRRTIENGTRINNQPPADRIASLPGLNNFSQTNNELAASGSLQDLELRLTSEMVKDPMQWQIESILGGAMRVRDSAPSANERLQATRLIEKCRNCLQVQSGFANGRSVSGVGGTAGRTSFQGSNAVGAGLKSNDQEVSFGTTYDAFGWLNELVRKQGELESEYVLQNRDGKITHHVIASPGLNLRRYLKSKVGIVGQRGYNHALNLDHVVADRVVVLDQSR